MPKKLTTEQFIEKARKVHGNKYDYSKVNYVNGRTNVCIICPIHGEFWQRPNNHLQGRGCPDCSVDNQTLTTEQFIEKAIKKHGYKYDYSKVEYIDSKTKVCIICPIHGEFWQIPDNHLRGKGCPDCGGGKKTTEQFIKEAKEVHSDKYDYSKVDYIDSRTKVCIKCPIHGEFWQEANSHLRGCVCPECDNDIRRKSSEQFIKEAKEKHGDKYDYSKVKYVNNYTNVCIICPEHGEFWQVPRNHLNGKGCPKCNSSKLETEISNCFPEFEREKKFDWLKDKGSLRLDFYDDDLKLGIECQGIQHFIPVNYFGGEERFDEELKRDKLKYTQCQEHGIDVVYYCPDDTNDLDFYKDKMCFYNPEDLFTFIRNRKQNAKKEEND
jgi:hypothetical protein